MYNTILVPLDGSKRAENVLPHVEELAHCYDAEVILLRVAEPPDVAVGVNLYLREGERRTKQATSYLSALQVEFREKGIETRIRVAHGPIVEAILGVAEDEGADLIAMASHGRSGLSRVFYGSVAAGVLHRVDRPLLIVRSQYDG